VLSVVLGSLVALTGCEGMRAVETSHEDLDFDVGTSPRIEVRLERGRIEAGSSSSGRVELEVRKRARGFDRSAARAALEDLGVEVREIEGGLRIETRGALSRRSRLDGMDGLDLVLRVPRGSELDLRTGDGSIEVKGVEGTVAAESGDGRIELDGVSGSMRARTADGSIRGRELSGRLDARTGDGRIELEGRFDALEATTGDGSIRVSARESSPRALSEGWVLRTSDGSIRLALPSGLSADVEASTLDGEVELTLPRFEGERRERRLRGKLGDGGALILATTMDGDVRLEEH